MLPARAPRLLRASLKHPAAILHLLGRRRRYATKLDSKNLQLQRRYRKVEPEGKIHREDLRLDEYPTPQDIKRATRAADWRKASESEEPRPSLETDFYERLGYLQAQKVTTDPHKLRLHHQALDVGKELEALFNGDLDPDDSRTQSGEALAKAAKHTFSRFTFICNQAGVPVLKKMEAKKPEPPASKKPEPPVSKTPGPPASYASMAKGAAPPSTPRSRSQENDSASSDGRSPNRKERRAAGNEARGAQASNQNSAPKAGAAYQPPESQQSRRPQLQKDKNAHPKPNAQPNTWPRGPERLSSSSNSQSTSRTPNTHSNTGAYTAAEYQRSESHKPRTVDSSSETLYILSLRVTPGLHEFLTSLRTRHFPAHLNKLSAHIALFHAIPGSKLQEVEETLSEVTRQTRAFRILPTDAFRMKMGVGINLRKGRREAEAVQHALAEAWRAGGWLSSQDTEGGFRPHVTVMNKVEDERAVNAALKDVERELQEFEMSEGKERHEATGVALWRYDRGRWVHQRDYPFIEDPFSANKT